MSNNIYNQFNKTLKYNLSNILKSTKDMIIDTKKFKGYSKNYYNFTQSTTFMKPEINEYPIIKIMYELIYQNLKNLFLYNLLLLC